MTEPRGHPGHSGSGGDGAAVSIPRLLFAVLGAPVLWSLHLAVVYFLLTVDCISGWNGGRWSILLATALFAAPSGWAGWTARSMHRRLSRGEGEAEWARFLLVLGMGGAAIFTAVIVLEGLAPLFTRLCP